MFTQRARRVLCALGVAVMVLAVPGAALGFDGEVGNAADSNSVTDVYVSGGRASVDTEYLHDCPTYISDCWIEVRFSSKCPEIWCGWLSDNWRRVSSTGFAQADCRGASNNDNIWKVDYRLHYVAPAVKTMEFWGENEGYLNLGGSFVYKLIAEVFFNVTNNTGTRYGTKIYTMTATSGWVSQSEIATSGGQVLITC